MLSKFRKKLVFVLIIYVQKRVYAFENTVDSSGYQRSTLKYIIMEIILYVIDMSIFFLMMKKKFKKYERDKTIAILL